MIHSYEYVLGQLKARYEQEVALTEAWKKVVIKTKKNGDEYKRLTKACVEGGTFENYAYEPKVKQISVFGSIVFDSCRHHYSDRLVVTNGNRYEDYVTISPAEAREKIKDKVKNLEKSQERLLAEIEHSEELYYKVHEAYETLHKLLWEGDYPCLQGELRNSIPRYF